MPPRGLLAEVRAAIGRDRLIDERDSVLVAVSGGPDSVALLEALAALGRGRWKLGVGHVNHGLRGARSDADARFVARLADDLGLPFHALDGTCGDGPNLEERARRRRYEVLLGAASREGYRRVATGHTLDDQAETFLHHLIRGSGTRGLGAIQARRTDGVIRPLLATTRETVLGFLRDRRRTWRRDATNLDPRFTRNRIRRRVLPLLEREVNPRTRRALARAARLLAEEEEWIDGLVARRLRAAARADGLAADTLARQPRAASRRIVRAWLASRRGGLEGIGFEHVEAILGLVEDRGARSVTIPGGVVRRRGAAIAWGAEIARDPGTSRLLRCGCPVSFGGFHLSVEARPGHGPRPSRWTAVFDRTSLGRSGLRVREARPGDRLRPVGLHGTKKLQDVFVDAKLPREERAAHPVITCGRILLWVPGLVRSEEALVSSATREVVVVRCRPPRSR